MLGDSWSWWWASSSYTLIYPSIFAFPLLPLHHWSTSTHPCTDVTAHNHTHTHLIRPISHIWWTHVLWFTCFTSILSNPNMCPPAVWPITSPRTMWTGTYYSFTSDEPYALFLVDHSYLTCLYLPFNTENHPYEFPPELKLSTYTSHGTASTSHHFSQLHCLYSFSHLEMIPYPQIAPSEPHRIYT